MIELSKYGFYVLSAYSITIGVLVAFSVLTLIDFFKTKNKLAKISKKGL